MVNRTKYNKIREKQNFQNQNHVLVGPTNQNYKIIISVTIDKNDQKKKERGSIYFSPNLKF
jgi:hypothetical protein